MATPQEVVKYVQNQATLPECFNIATLVATRWAATMEKTHQPTDQAWESVAYYQDQLFKFTSENLQVAFNLAVDQVLLPPGSNSEDEYYRQWVRSNGLTTLADHRLKDNLVSFLLTNESQPLQDFFASTLNTPVKPNITFEDLYNPAYYNLMISLRLLDNLKAHSSVNVDQLIHKAQDLLLSRSTQHLAQQLSQISGLSDLFGEYC
ncbi:MAG: hypothetical protein WCT01_02580 [Candidatus Shapirobacteria bacterium]